MIIDLSPRRSIVGLAAIKRAEEFFFLGIHAQNGETSCRKRLASDRDVFELGVS